MFNFPYIVESRQKAALLIRSCLYDGYLVREALKRWPDSSDDPTLLCARHALIHFEADKEIHKNTDYFDQQIEWMEQLINMLSKGQPIPKNIIESYEEYYLIPETFKYTLMKLLAKILYPFVSLLTNILKFVKGN